MLRIIIMHLLLLPGITANTQNSYPQEDFIPPLGIPIKLSGTFGELRSDHFHSGIDIKTGEKEGLNVYAIADGYVSRIKIQSGGYGKAIYITHPNGYLSVYGHLSKYNEKIDAFVKNEQYKKRSYEINIYPPENEIIVKQGDIIAYSGNSGRSGGPHLHFEIRDAAYQKPINPLLFNYKVNDNIPPRINVLKVYSIDGNKKSNHEGKVYFCKSYGNKYRLDKTDTVTANGSVYFGINTIDPFNGGINKNGVYMINLYINDQLHYSHKLEKFSFDETRYINSLIDYPEYKINRRQIQKSYVQPNNNLSIYKKHKGPVKIGKGDKISVRYEVSDIAGNVSTLNFWVKGISTDKNAKPGNAENDNTSHFSYKKNNIFRTDAVELQVPGRALYDNLHFIYNRSEPVVGSYSDVHHIHTETIPLHTWCILKIKPDSLPEELTNKAVIAKLEQKNGTSSWGGEWYDGEISTRIREFGDYCIMIDTIPPEITPVNIRGGKSLLAQHTIKVKIKDELSGIASYDAYLNKNWILMEYDEKNDLLVYYFDKNLQEGENVFKLIVRDDRNNYAEYETTLQY